MIKVYNNLRKKLRFDNNLKHKLTNSGSRRRQQVLLNEGYRTTKNKQNNHDNHNNQDNDNNNNTIEIIIEYVSDGKHWWKAF